MLMSPKQRPREIAKRVKARYNLDVTPEQVEQTLAIMRVATDMDAEMKAKRDEQIHNDAMRDALGPLGQG